MLDRLVKIVPILLLFKLLQVNALKGWDQIPALKELRWQDCSSGFQCARLIVPLDYENPEGREATIALMRLQASVPEDSVEYKGPIICNPGGPGGSGISLIERFGTTLSTIVGPEFDIVSFDPRGTSLSRPLGASFFSTVEERAFFADGLNLGVVSNSDDGIARTFARKSLLGQLAVKGDDDFLRFINTENTARDMLKIVEAYGREKIMYWGFSYGTILGATFATIFPDKIDRLVIDGVADSENYYATLWSNNLEDTDKAYDSFFSRCFSAGPGRCAFYAPTEEAIRKNLTELVENIRRKPLAVFSDTSYGILDYSTIRLAIFISLQRPIRLFPVLAQGLADAAHGNGSVLYNMVHPPPFRCQCDSGGPDGPGPSDAIEGGDAYTTISCNDGDVVPNDLEKMNEYFDMMTGLNQWGEIWSGLRMNCVNWPKFPKSKFRGPFEANTSHPILVISNTADPVTPLAAGLKMSKGFKGSVVVTQDSVGHCSLAEPSVCTAKHVRSYFVNGTLPKAGTVCPADAKPFDPVTNLKQPSQEGVAMYDGARQAPLSDGDRVLFDELLKASKSGGLGGKGPLQLF